MACPITISKFVGTVSLGLLTGLSYATSVVTIPAIHLLPTSVNAARCLKEVKRLNRRYALRLSSLANASLLFGYFLSSPRRRHPFLVWMYGLSALSSFGLDFFFNRHLGFNKWARTAIYDVTGLRISGSRKKREEDVVVVDPEETVNGESVQREMKQERRLQIARTWVAGLAMSVGVVGLWGDRSV